MSTQHNSLIAKAVRFALIGGAVAAAATSVAFAADDTNGEEGKITVTGSRIKRTDIETASPVMTISHADIVNAGYTNAEEILNSLSQFEVGQTAYISNGATGTASVDLRGLGPQRTLVLLNGRRLPPGGVGTETPDINAIPAAMIERVDVLTGGGSSTYGSDAVAGVVNFITRKNYEGVEVEFGASGYQHNNRNNYMRDVSAAKGFDIAKGSTGIDGKGENLSILIGTTSDKGHVTAYGTWRKSDALLEGTRDYANCALSTSGTSCGGSGNAPNPNFYFYAAPGGTVDPNVYTSRLTLDKNSNFVDGSTNIYNFAPVNFFFRPDERFSLGAEAGYEVNEHFKPFLEVNYMNDRSVAQIAESGTFFKDTYILDVNNPLFNDSQRNYFAQNLGDPDFVGVQIGKRNVEGGGRQSITDYSNYRLVGGVEGDIAGSWTYNASYNYSAVSSSLAYVNDFFGPRIFSALGAVNSPGTCDACIPYEVFTYNGVTKAQAAPLLGKGVQVSRTSIETANAYVTGDLPFGFSSPIAVVGGLEHRTYKYAVTADEVFESGLLLGQGGPTPSIAGKYDVSEVFTEFLVPIVANAPGFKNLGLEIGARSTDYSTSGQVTTYKFGIDWGIVDALKVRAAFNHAIRAPNINELYSIPGLGLWSGDDFCAGATPVATAAQCANSGVTAAEYGHIGASPAAQYNQFGGGNPDLQPETADTFTFGFVAEPIDNWSMTVDYFDIHVKDSIGAPGAQNYLEECVYFSKYCDHVHRSSTGSLFRGDSQIDNPTINQGEQRFKGVDLSSDYSFAMGSGKMKFHWSGTYFMKKEFAPLEDVPYDCAGAVSINCTPQAKWRHALSSTYSMSDWDIGLRWRYVEKISDYTSRHQIDTLLANGIRAYNYLDLFGSFALTKEMKVNGGINNIADKEPPLVGSTTATNANTYAGQYDTLGRFLFLNVTMTF